MLVLDTDVMVDILRGHSAAIEWLGSVADEVLILPGLVLMELVNGCRNGDEVQRLLSLTRVFPIRWPREADCERALRDFVRGRMSHNLGILDALIAESAVGLGAALCTFNVKHFNAIPHLTTVQPYEK
ncbi:MAG: PIN domain-containing protein [Thermodesulfobacteriota bacterium]